LCRYGVLRTFTKVRALPQAKVEALLSAVTELAELECPLPVSPPLLHRLNELVPSDWCAYSQLDRVRKRAVFNAWCAGGSVGISTAASEDSPYWRLRDQHPVCGYRESTDDWISARKASDFVTLREFRQREIWNELYRDTGINYWLDIGLPPEANGQTRVFIFTRRHRDFDESDRITLELLQPHLLRRYTTAMVAAEAAGALATTLEDGQDEGPHDIVLCSPGGVIEFASRRSRQLLATYFGPSTAHLPEPLIDAVAATSLPLATSRGHRTLTVRVARTGTLLVLLLEERDTRSERLTRREREILGRVALGESDAEIAAALDLAIATVGKHLEHIYKRLDVHSRTAAAALLLRRCVSAETTLKTERMDADGEAAGVG
jgi:DNA-binding CsgD family transcriptional regulator